MTRLFSQVSVTSLAEVGQADDSVACRHSSLFWVGGKQPIWLHPVVFGSMGGLLSLCAGRAALQPAVAGVLGGGTSAAPAETGGEWSAAAPGAAPAETGGGGTSPAYDHSPPPLRLSTPGRHGSE